MASAAQTYQIVVFKIDDELYGIDILKVQEILSYLAPSPIPNAPEYFKGVINLRGTIIPVVDLRIRFNFDKITDEKTSVIVVVSIDDKKYGLVVDSVSDVLSITQDNIQENIDIHSGIDSRYITGIAKTSEQMIILVDINKMFRKEEIDTMNAHLKTIQ